jgi:hypothetical protein
MKNQSYPHLKKLKPLKNMNLPDATLGNPHSTSKSRAQNMALQFQFYQGGDKRLIVSIPK